MRRRSARDALAREQRLLGPSDPRTMDAMDILAVIKDSEGQYQEEEKLLRELLALQIKRLGQDEPQTIRTLANLAGAVSAEGRWAEAERMYADVLALERRVLGPDHPQTVPRRCTTSATTFRRKDVTQTRCKCTGTV